VESGKNHAYYALPPNWIFGVDIVGGFYASNPGDSIRLTHYPQNWYAPEFDDSGWKPAKWIWNINNENEGGFFWLMKPRTTPQVTQTIERFPAWVRAEGIPVTDNFVKGNSPVQIPAHSQAILLFDYQTVTLGYPELTISGGKDAKITLHYAENLYNDDLTKGDRNDIRNKHIRGVKDILIADGKSHFTFSPTWYRAFRFIQLDVETSEEPLTLEDFYHMATVAPIKRKAVFDCDNAVYRKIDEICWRTSYICTQDNLMSDAYYEQMMYVGDSRIHALVNLYMTGEDIWLKNAIEQFDYSRMPDGNITSCYPLKATFVHPNFSLVWIDMLHDFMMHCDDKEFITRYKQSIRSTLMWFEDNLLSNGLVGKPVDSYFVDWYNDAPFEGEGLYPGSRNGNSAVVTFHYAATLLRTAELFDYLGETEEAKNYRVRAEKVKQDVVNACWDPEKGLFAENPDKKFYDERANIMGITARIFNEEEQKALFERCLRDSTISKSVYYFRFNHFKEMRRLGLSHYLDDVLDIWKNLLPLNMTTVPERMAKQRSEAHPWSASPSIAFIQNIAGITPAEPGYKSVDIQPELGELTWIEASYPHHKGNIKVELRKTDQGILEGSVELPLGLTGNFRWKEHTLVLKEGKQKINLQ